MQYKMQFTVLDDAVKQNRKLPEIAFFDTDGNLIHLGGGEGGEGSVDLTHLTELGFGSPTDVTLERDLAGNFVMRDLADGGYIMVEGSGGFYAAEEGKRDLSGSYVGIDPNGILYISAAGTAGEVIKVGDVTDSAQRFIVDAHGKIMWGAGTGALDVSLERVESNDDPYLRVRGHGEAYQWSQIAAESWDVTLPDIVYQAALYADEAGYAGVYLQPGGPEFEILTSKINNAGVLEGDFRFAVRADGSLHWGDGTDVPDTALYRSGGFGAGYGHLSADAGGGFEVMSSAPEAEGSFVQIVPDAGYGGYLWIHNLSGHTDKDALYFDVEGEANPRFKAKMDGSLHWGDGTNAPDVTLERFNQGSVQLVGNGEWDYTDFIIGKSNFSGDHANLEMYADAEEAYLVATYPAGSDLSNDILYAHMYGEPARYRVHLDGSMHWGGGTAQPDTHLKRTAPGTLEIDHILSFKGDAGDATAGATLEWSDDYYGLVIKGRPDSGDAELYLIDPDNDLIYANVYPGGIATFTQGTRFLQSEGQIAFGLHGEQPDTTWARASPGVWQIPEHGGGIKLTSPDGSQTKTIRLSNAGALELV